MNSPGEDKISKVTELFGAIYTWMNVIRDGELPLDAVGNLLMQTRSSSLSFSVTFIFLENNQLLTTLTHQAFLSTYTAITSTESKYQCILLEANGLQAVLKHYGKDLPLSNLYIHEPKHMCVCQPKGTSNCHWYWIILLSNALLDKFLILPTTPETKVMEGLKGQGWIEVLGAGPVSRDLKDVHGVQHTLKTTAYIVSDANMVLHLRTESTKQVWLPTTA